MKRLDYNAAAFCRLAAAVAQLRANVAEYRRTAGESSRKVRIDVPRRDGLGGQRRGEVLQGDERSVGEIAVTAARARVKAGAASLGAGGPNPAHESASRPRLNEPSLPAPRAMRFAGQVGSGRGRLEEGALPPALEREP